MASATAVVWVVRGDEYHPASRVDEAIAAAWADTGWQVHLTCRARDVLAAAPRLDLAVFFACGRPSGEAALSPAEERDLVRRVHDGMGLLRVHAGLVLIEPASPLCLELNTGRFVSHPPSDGGVEYPVVYAPVRPVRHPVVAGVEAFGGRDEHYWCQVAVERTEVLLAGTSAVGTSVAGWAHAAGAGRVACLTPGHTSEVLLHPMMQRLLRQAAAWCGRSSGQGGSAAPGEP